MLLLKNPQFFPNHDENLSKCVTNEYLILTKNRQDWAKIVDFLIKAYFFMCTLFLHQTLVRIYYLLSLFCNDTEFFSHPRVNWPLEKHSGES